MDSLLERVNAGDESAATELFEKYAPYLRIVIHRQLSGRLRAKFDSIDVVQSVWADVVRGLRQRSWRFESVEQFRGFLTTATRNRFLNRVRHLRRALKVEGPLPEASDAAPPAAQPTPSEAAQADDLWQRMLRLCPAEHRRLLQLRREGLTLEEIARQIGLHPGSVRRILYDLARRLEVAPVN